MIITIKGAPKLLCSDLGTENSIVSFIQPFLRGVVTSFRYVKSVSNQVYIYIIII